MTAGSCGTGPAVAYPEDVIRLKVSGSHDGPGILDDLYTLARSGASGAVEINGDPGGTIYLNESHLTFAESAATPDLASRLIGSGRLSGEQWNLFLTGNRPHDGIGALLVKQGLITEEELRAVLRSIVLDVLIALTVMPIGRSPTIGLRLAPRARPWVGSLLSLEIESVRAEAVRRAELLARHEVSLEARPKLSDLRRPWGTVRREHWPIIGKIDGVTTVRELAWRHGFALYDTIESVGEFVRGGFCTLLPAERPNALEVSAGRPASKHRGAVFLSAPAPGEASGAAWPPWGAGPASSPPSPEVALLPRRRRQAPPAPVMPDAGAASHDVPHGLADDPEPPFAPAHLDVLSRALEGLRRME